MLFKKDINKKIEHLVKKNDFYAVADYVYGTKEEMSAQNTILRIYLRSLIIFQKKKSI